MDGNTTALLYDEVGMRGSAVGDRSASMKFSMSKKHNV
jgi:hypothetical protein